MKTIRQQYVESFPPPEQAEAERITRRLVTDEDDPLLWLLLQIKRAQEASQKVSEWKIAQLEKSLDTQLTAQFRDARQILAQLYGPKIWRKLLISKLLSAIITAIFSATTAAALVFFWRMPELTQSNQAVTELNQKVKELKENADVISADQIKLSGNQERLYRSQVEMDELVRKNLDELAAKKAKK